MEFSLFTHKPGWQNGYHQALQANEKLTSIFNPASKSPVLPARLSFLSIDDSNALVSTIKKSESDNGLIIRIYDQEGRDKSVKVNLYKAPVSIEKTVMVEEKLKEKNTRIELDILDALSEFSIDIKMHEVMNDQMISNSAFLINRSKKEKFEKVIDRLDEKYDGKLNYKLVGPLPCYSFYTIEVKEINLEQVAQAKKVLGLSESASDAEIKKAWQDKAKEFHPDVSQLDGSKDSFNRMKKAYHTLLEYAEAASHTTKEPVNVLSGEKVIENMIVVKIKE